MIPSFLMVIDQMPLTKNGKLDRKALPDPETIELSNQDFVEPIGSMEQTMVKIWSDVLKIDKISTHSNFFHIGGNSLRAMKVLSRIHKDLGIKIHLKLLFTHPTVAQLVGEITSMDNNQSYQSIEPVANSKYYDVSHAQKRLWVIHHFEENQVAYNMPASYMLGGVDKELIETSFLLLIQSCLLYTSPSPRDGLLSRMPSSA